MYKYVHTIVQNQSNHRFTWKSCELGEAGWPITADTGDSAKKKCQTRYVGDLNPPVSAEALVKPQRKEQRERQAKHRQGKHPEASRHVHLLRN